jgi:hypothetical protein
MRTLTAAIFIVLAQIQPYTPSAPPMPPPVLPYGVPAIQVPAAPQGSVYTPNPQPSQQFIPQPPGYPYAPLGTPPAPYPSR